MGKGRWEYKMDLDKLADDLGEGIHAKHPEKWLKWLCVMDILVIERSDGNMTQSNSYEMVFIEALYNLWNGYIILSTNLVLQ